MHHRLLAQQIARALEHTDPAAAARADAIAAGLAVMADELRRRPTPAVNIEWPAGLGSAERRKISRSIRAEVQRLTAAHRDESVGLLAAAAVVVLAALR